MHLLLIFFGIYIHIYYYYRYLVFIIVGYYLSTGTYFNN